jgi:hypothetical protein
MVMPMLSPHRTVEMAVLLRTAQKESGCAAAPLKKNDDASPHRTERMTVRCRTTLNVYRKSHF